MLHAELSGLFASAPAILDAPSMTTFGAELRLVVGNGALRGTLAAAYSTRSSFELVGVHGDVTRVPASAGLRWHMAKRNWALDGDLGLLVAFERVRSTGLVETRSSHIVELGARAGLSVQSVWSPYFAPFIGAFAGVTPGPRELSAAPRGEIGNLPYLWIGAAAGVSLGL